jgi:hypothetical protein
MKRGGARAAEPRGRLRWGSPPARARIGLVALACVSMCGCFGLGTSRLFEDQVGYSRALGDAEKSATLLNVVRMRYGDPPTFLQATQVISGYQLQHNLTAGFEAFPAASPSTYLSGLGSVQLQQSPTFTFQPLSGEQFAKSFIRPLSPADLLPLAMSGLPIDVLFRLGVQSTNELSNAVALTQTGAAGSPRFFLLLRDLRRLQIAGLLSVRLQEAAPAGPHGDSDAGDQKPDSSQEKETTGNRAKSDPGRVYLSISETREPELAATVAEAKRLLGMSEEMTQAEVVYGRSAERGQVAILTRSMLGVLSQVAIQVDVPAIDVLRHRTLPTVGNAGLEHRPVVIIHSGPKLPEDAFTSVRYHQTWFWIAEDDFDSKLAFTVLQLLLALSRTQTQNGAIVTIPAG